MLPEQRGHHTARHLLHTSLQRFKQNAFVKFREIYALARILRQEIRHIATFPIIWYK